jgi:hypothetical protein
MGAVLHHSDLLPDLLPGVRACPYRARL